MKYIDKKYLHNSIVLCAVLSVTLNIVIESLGRRSLVLCFNYMIHSPLTFLFNSFIIFTSYSIIYLVRRRIFTYVVISILWLGIGITNGIILGFRMTPFTMTDLALFDDGLKVVTNYISTVQIVLIVAAIVVLFAVLILIFLFMPKLKQKINYKKSLAGVLLIIISMVGLTDIAIDRDWVSTFFGNLNYAYRDYGVPYCFVNTWLNTGVTKPKNYTKEEILGMFSKNELQGTLVADSNSQMITDSGNAKPNIVMVQLESFFDPTTLKGVTYSQDPVPNFRKLKESSSTGYMTVPSIGAGTANTEFEVLSGMSAWDFGPGEYPYKSVLKDKTVETVAYDLKNLGYSTHAIHNHRGDFYGRNKVFANMGFDTFTSVEYMNKVTKTPRNFEQDKVLTGEILSTLKSTADRDYIYTISVQGHGSYPTTKVYDNPVITASGINVKSDAYALEYYLQQVHDEDAFIGDLVQAIKNFDEDTIVVFYGDHLPPLELTDQELTTNNIFNEQYVIWSNFSLPTERKNLYSYQLSAEILNRIGIHEGYITKYHQDHIKDASYRDRLKDLEYDMLYGKQYLFDGNSPFAPTKLKMGIKDIKVDKVVKVGSKYYIKGENFTPYSKISVDGEVLKTIYLGPSVLGLLEDINSKDVGKMKVSQVQTDSILSTSE
jgi:phosphoglycerol transferase MdoB-like AlkP superfamily enzyme